MSVLDVREGSTKFFDCSLLLGIAARGGGHIVHGRVRIQSFLWKFFSKTSGVYTCNCDDRYGYLMRENMLCAGEEGKDSCSGLNLVWEIYFYLNCWHQLGCRWQWRSTCLPPWWRFDSTPGRGHFLGPGLWQVQQPFANLPIQILTYYYYQHLTVLYDGATSIRRWLLT